MVRAGIRSPGRGMPFRVSFRLSHMPSAARAVARVPRKKSRGSAAEKVRLNSRHPMLRPGTAAGVKKARMHSASLSRIWMAQVAEPGRSRFCRWVSVV